MKNGSVVQIRNIESNIKWQTYPTENKALFIAVLECASATKHFAINIFPFTQTIY